MATVIKAGHTQADPRGMACSTFNFDDMSYRANDYLAGVRRQAADLLRRAEAEGERIKEQARQEGHCEGLASARQTMSDELKQQLQTLMPALARAMSDIAAAKTQLLKRWEQDILKLSIAIAEKIIRRELRQSPEIPLARLRESLELSAGSPEITIRLSPEDMGTLADQAERLVSEMAPTVTARFRGDPQVTAGGCKVDTVFGAIDQRIESQLARVEEELAN